jgi:hypothetical protein
MSTSKHSKNKISFKGIFPGGDPKRNSTTPRGNKMHSRSGS